MHVHHIVFNVEFARILIVKMISHSNKSSTTSSSHTTRTRQRPRNNERNLNRKSYMKPRDFAERAGKEMVISVFIVMDDLEVGKCAHGQIHYAIGGGEMYHLLCGHTV